MFKRNSRLVLRLGVLAVLALSMSASATAFRFPDSSITNAIMDPTKWETVSLPHVNPIEDDFLNAANTWTISYKRVLVAPITNPGTNFRIVGPVIFHGAIATSAANADRPFYFNGNPGSLNDLIGTFDDLRLQGTIQGATTRRAFLAGNLRLSTDANGLPAPTAIQVRSGQQLNITAAIDAADCNSIDIVYYLRTDTAASDSQISLRNTANKIYSKFVLDAGLYANVAGSLGDADVEIGGSNPADYRAGKLTIQATGGISTNAKVSIITDATGMNTDAVRLNLGANSATIRELWVDGSKETATLYYGTANAPAWLSVTGAGSLTITNTPTQDVTMVASPAGDPNIRIYPPVGTKAYAQDYVVALSAPNPKNAPYVFKNWTSVGATVANPLAANTTVTVPVGTDITVTAVYDGAAHSPVPVDTQTNVNVFTDLSWTDAPGQTAQTVYFGTTNPPVTTVTNVGNTVSNAALGGRLADSTMYYWYVRSTIGGTPIDGPVWSFTTANSTPNTPSPAIGAVVAIGGTRLSWSEAPSGGGSTLRSVYFSTSQSLVAARTAPTITPDANGFYNSGPLVVSTTYYWAVDATYRNDANGVLGVGTGPVWNFNAQKKILYIKTEIAGYSINGAPDVNGVANGCYVDDANTVIYTFPTFNYDGEWDIVVSGPRMFAIWSDAGINIGGRMDISGGVYFGTSTRGDTNFGPAHAGANAGVPGTNNWATAGTLIYPGTASVNGAGFGWATSNSPVGAGGGFGGAGGRAGRWSTANGGFPGLTYGEPELFSLMAGSGGGGGKNDPTGGGGGGGGGAVELYAKAGNIDIQSTAVIDANGAAPKLAAIGFAGAGGSGGGVRLVASGNVTMAGSITANGGKGGNNSGTNANNCGGGGGGGRIAIYRGGTLMQTGTIRANGANPGVNTTGATFAGSGADGTIYTSGATSTLLASYNPRPQNGNVAWSLDPNYAGGKTLSWTPARGTTQNKLYFSTVQADVVNGVPGALKATINVAAPANFMHARKTYTPSPALVTGTKYYWRVDTNGVAGPVWSFATGTCSNPAGDLDGDCKITYKDLKVLADTWLVCNLPAGSCF